MKKQVVWQISRKKPIKVAMQAKPGRQAIAGRQAEVSKVAVKIRQAGRHANKKKETGRKAGREERTKPDMQGGKCRQRKGRQGKAGKRSALGRQRDTQKHIGRQAI
jgi:hypothetical protein